MEMIDIITRLRQQQQGMLRKGEFAFINRSDIVELLTIVDALRAERDEARRLLKDVVDMMRDNMAHDATHPHHLCDFIHRPDIGMCKVCEDWTDAMVMCYPDDFQDEEDGK